MGLLNKLTLQGSTLSIANVGSVAINPLSTPQSELQEYSLNGANAQTVNAQYQQYIDGAANILPAPSQLDLNGLTPTQYINNLPQ